MRAAKDTSFARIAQMDEEKGSSHPSIFIARQPCRQRYKGAKGHEYTKVVKDM
jgi:hypothetical protein